eukprot:TRINITY_DN103499_c0_g1_i2.p1 TRINITY_DN103499_c0_g1~~TRINITY_DN103499_c0_g1_i2.p1  ORF type:complete len:305 (+),score=61.51 TRINITY_DN103499_c0_g1_i2:17-931(+)
MAAHGRSSGRDASKLEVYLLPMPAYNGLRGADILTTMHESQKRNPIRDVWTVKLPKKLIEYISSVCEEHSPQIRQDAVLMLKRYAWQYARSRQGDSSAMYQNLQVVALTCANLAAKHWQQHGIPEQRLHWLSRNSFTRQDFIEAEVDVLRALDCNVHWDGVLLAEWVPLVLHLCASFFKQTDQAAIVNGVAAHVSDVLAFQDDLMSSYWPSELAAATLHASMMLCTKCFHQYAVSLRINHLCRCDEAKVANLSEKILAAAIGHKCAELILEGSGMTADDYGSQDQGFLTPVLKNGESDHEALQF